MSKVDKGRSDITSFFFSVANCCVYSTLMVYSLKFAGVCIQNWCHVWFAKSGRHRILFLYLSHSQKKHTHTHTIFHPWNKKFSSTFFLKIIIHYILPRLVYLNWPYSDVACEYLHEHRFRFFKY